jgi:hypothetical protein
MDTHRLPLHVNDCISSLVHHVFDYLHMAFASRGVKARSARLQSHTNKNNSFHKLNGSCGHMFIMGQI